VVLPPAELWKVYWRVEDEDLVGASDDSIIWEGWRLTEQHWKKWRSWGNSYKKSLFYVLTALGFELRASHLLVRHQTPTLFLELFFQIKSHFFFAQAGLDLNPLIYTSRVAWMTGVSHCPQPERDVLSRKVWGKGMGGWGD
jgi:hypothetical protein